MSDKENKKRKAAVTIRDMDIDDISPVYHLGEKLFTSEGFPILYRTWDPYDIANHYSTDSDYCLVAETEERIVGFILATTIEKEGTAWKKYGYISWIGVDKAYHRTNVGLRLYRRLEDKYREDGVRMVIADTQADNKGAIGFFKTIGFSISGHNVWLAKTLRRQANRVAKPDHILLYPDNMAGTNELHRYKKD
jgi:ribosomal protein S18 acetylase RimI-like enzyme